MAALKISAAAAAASWRCQRYGVAGRGGSNQQCRLIGGNM